MKLHRLLLGLICVAICCPADADEAAISAKDLKHTSTNGHACSAIILKASNLPKSDRRQHFILIDTSASQVGEHRQQSLAVLTSLLKSLPAGDQVRLFAVDLRAEPLDQGLNEAHSAAVADSIEVLKFRVPLGATNMEGVLRTAITAASQDPGLHHTLGLTLTRQKRSDEALMEFKLATELEPDRSRYAYVYAVALHSARRVEESMKVLKESVARHPDDRDSLLALVSFSRDAGDIGAALEYGEQLTRLAPNDRELKGLVEDLRSRLKK